MNSFWKSPKWKAITSLSEMSGTFDPVLAHEHPYASTIQSVYADVRPGGPLLWGLIPSEISSNIDAWLALIAQFCQAGVVHKGMSQVEPEPLCITLLWSLSAHCQCSMSTSFLIILSADVPLSWIVVVFHCYFQKSKPETDISLHSCAKLPLLTFDLRDSKKRQDIWVENLS